jgi:cytochrome c oxidase subunit II
LAPPRKRSALVLAWATLLTLAIAAPAEANVISPEPSHSPQTTEITTLYWIALVAVVLLAVAINGALIFALRRYRSERGAEPRQIRSAGGIQLRVGAGLGALALLLLVLGIVFTERAREAPASESAPVEITATGQQWLWRYAYPNDAFSYYKLVVPVDTNVTLRLLSTDVVHSWYVPELAGKFDAVPGKLNEVVFRADEEGIYEGSSATFSGQGYPAMRTEVDVVSADDYKSFISQQKKDIQSAQDQVVSEIQGGNTP